MRTLGEEKDEMLRAEPNYCPPPAHGPVVVKHALKRQETGLQTSPFTTSSATPAAINFQEVQCFLLPPEERLCWCRDYAITTTHAARGVPHCFGGEEWLQPAGQVPACRQDVTPGGRAGGWVSPEQRPIPSHLTERSHPASGTEERHLAQVQEERIQGLC